MTARGSRPEHRRGTTGRPWRAFRKGLVDPATNCCYCGKVFVRDARCTHPNHAGLKGCPTHPDYPTVEHPRSLIRGGAVRDKANATVACFSCNSSRGAAERTGARGSPLIW